MKIQKNKFEYQRDGLMICGVEYCPAGAKGEGVAPGVVLSGIMYSG